MLVFVVWGVPQHPFLSVDIVSGNQLMITEPLLSTSLDKSRFCGCCGNFPLSFMQHLYWSMEADKLRVARFDLSLRTSLIPTMAQ